MLKFAANLSLMYTEFSFLERFAAAAKDGFKGVEFLFPYAYPQAELLAHLQAHGLQQVLFNAPAGGVDASSIQAAWEQGERGLAALAGRETEFRAGFELALDYAQALECPRIHVMAGVLVQAQRDGSAYAAAQATYLTNLEWACRQAEKINASVMIEPINTRDFPRYFLNYQAQAHEVVQLVGASNLKVQMDLYHCQIVEGDVATKIKQYLPTGRVGHMQIAGVPERHEPSMGELHYPYLFEVIAQACAQGHWDGWIGCEYRPFFGGESGGTSKGLSWLREVQGSQPNSELPYAR